MTLNWLGGAQVQPIPFFLESGAAQLAHWFVDVTLVRYEDSLLVTEPAPLIDYILSGRLKLAVDQRRAFVDFVSEEFQRAGGGFHITKDSGIFVARRSEQS